MPSFDFQTPVIIVSAVSLLHKFIRRHQLFEIYPDKDEADDEREQDDELADLQDNASNSASEVRDSIA